MLKMTLSLGPLLGGNSECLVNVELSVPEGEVELLGLLFADVDSSSTHTPRF
jgi:hypothetical protein